MKQTGKFYWLCQIYGWGAYTAVGVSSSVLEHGWTRDVWGYAWFFLYNTGLRSRRSSESADR
jgi:hypothetical protein